MRIGLRRRLVAAAVVVALVLGGVGLATWLVRPASAPAPRPAKGRPLLPVPDVRPAGFADPPPGEGLRRYQSQPVNWSPCAEGPQCAEVLAPLDYAAPDETALTLFLVRKPASQARRGSLFLNPGGPGGSGVDLAANFPTAGLETYDLVGWDPRGVGRSTPVTCQDGGELEAYVRLDASPDDREETEDLLDSQTEFGASCLEQSGVLLEHITTQETVQDLDLLRGLLGDDKLNFLGFSYGTEIGANYAERYGDRVGRMVLDGAVDLGRDSPVPQAQGFERALRGFARWCVQKDCGLGGTPPQVLRAIVDLWQRLDAEPLRVESRSLNQTLAVAAVVVALYDDERAWPSLAAALRSTISDGEGRNLLALSDQSTRRNRDGSYEQITYSFPAIRCVDSPDDSLAAAERKLARQTKAAPTIGPFFGADVVCPLWPVAPRPGPRRLTAPDAPPLVVIGSTGDSATPYEYAVDMAEELESAVLVTRRGAGHTAYGKSPCIDKLVQGFLTQERVPRDGTTC